MWWGRLRLDVTVGFGREIYSWEGAPHFDDCDIDEIIGNGPIGNGDFGPFLGEIFGGDARITYRGQKVVKGKRFLEYGFIVERARSHSTSRARETSLSLAMTVRS